MLWTTPFKESSLRFLFVVDIAIDFRHWVVQLYFTIVRAISNGADCIKYEFLVDGLVMVLITVAVVLASQEVALQVVLHWHRMLIQPISKEWTASAAWTSRTIPTHVLSCITSSESDLSLVHRRVMWVKLRHLRLSHHLLLLWWLGHDKLLASLNVLRLIVVVLCSRRWSFIVMALILMLMQLVHGDWIVLEVCETELSL